MEDDMIDKDEKIILSGEQESALRLMMSGANMFLTGEAGTGKSTLVREFLRRCDRECVVLAPTGIAALNAGGTTIHLKAGWPGFGSVTIRCHASGA